MRAQPLASRRFFLCFDGLEVRRQRHLRVDEDDRVAGKRDRHVGAALAVFAVERLLLAEVAIRFHAGQLDDAAQLHLAPLAAGRRIAQRRDQRRRFRREFYGRRFELLGATKQPGELLFQTAGVHLAAAFDLAHELFELAEFLRDGRDEFADAFAGARSGAFAEFVFRTFEQRFDGRFAGALRFGERRAQGSRLGTAGEPEDRAADGGAGGEGGENPKGEHHRFNSRYFL